MNKNWVLVGLLGLGLLPTQANAGECKVKDPAKETIEDAIVMSGINDFVLDNLRNDFKDETGKELRVVLVSRAGSDLSSLSVLKDVDANGRPYTIADLAKLGVADPSSIDYSKDSPAVNPQWVKETLKAKYGDPQRSIDYSHVGFMIWNHAKMKRKPTDPGGWMAMHMLRPCKIDNPTTEDQRITQRDLNHPYIWFEGPVAFFADDPWKLNAQYIVPTPEIQERLLEILVEGEDLYKLNSTFYNAAASWKNLKESNSNQFVAEVIAAASRPKNRVTNRAEAQQVLAETGFRPTKVVFGGSKALAHIPFATKIVPSVTYHKDEQPFYAQYSIGEIITTRSLEEYMRRNGMIHKLLDIEGPPKIAPDKPEKQQVNPNFTGG